MPWWASKLRNVGTIPQIGAKNCLHALCFDVDVDVDVINDASISGIFMHSLKKSAILSLQKMAKSCLMLPKKVYLNNEPWNMAPSSQSNSTPYIVQK